MKRKNLKVILTIGIQASGKSTWAKKYISNRPNYVIVSRDSFRKMFRNAQVVDTKIEVLITEMLNQAVIGALNKKLNVIVDNTHLNKSHIDEIAELVKYKADLEYIVFETSEAKAIERDSKRDAKVGKDVIAKAFKRYKTLVGSFDFTPRKKISNNARSKEILKTYDNDLNLQEAVIFDIDGTLSHVGKRDFMDWHKVDVDYLNPIVAEHIDFHRSKGRKIVICTGRSAEAKELTIEWLKFYNIYFDEIYTRKKGDYRRDSIIKKEIYENYIKSRYFIKVIYDDRNQVVNMWRKNYGLTVFQVQEGNF